MKNKNRLKLVVDDTHIISRKKGNGLLRRQVWVDAKGKIQKYSLAYINPLLHAGDNGRVIGFDNAHGYDHKHFFGKITPVEFINYEETERRFENEFTEIHEKAFNK